MYFWLRAKKHYTLREWLEHEGMRVYRRQQGFGNAAEVLARRWAMCEA